MKQYLAGKIRNVAIVGHASAGKTSMAEALLFKTHGTDRLGKIGQGNTICDFDPEEIKREASINTAIAPIIWGSVKINLIDTPGLFDFSTGFYEGMLAAESALILVSGKSGVSVGTVRAYKTAQKMGKARMFYVNKIDSSSSDFYKVFEELKSNFGPSVCPLVAPKFKDGKIECFINLVHDEAYKYDENGKYHVIPMPDIGHRLEGLKASMDEAIAETSEELFDKYFSGEPFTRTEILSGIHEGVKNGTITPMLCGSALELQGISPLLDAMADHLPSAWESGDRIAKTEASGDVLIKCTDEAPFSAQVFKTTVDPFTGKQNYIKVVSGMLKANSSVLNVRTGEMEKIGKIYYVVGKKQLETEFLAAGDIGIVLKLNDTVTGDTLCDPKNKVEFKQSVYPKPTLSMAVQAKNKGDEPKIAAALTKMLDEDPCMRFGNNHETGEQILSGIGEQHLETIATKAKTKFGVDMELSVPKIAYRETIRKTVTAEGKHKKQSGGHGQYGHVMMRFEPNGYEPLVFDEEVVGGRVPRNYFPAVEKGLQDCVKQGVLAGYPVLGLKAVLYDGSYHDVDSSEMAFKQAVTLAYKAGMKDARPAILEPIGVLKAYVPDENTGDLIGELNKRRGQISGMAPCEDGLQEVTAEVPISEMHDFTTRIRQIAHDRGFFSLEFCRYDELPANLEAKVISEATN
ncbi:MAG: elongation factor G [Clostridia bacterium]